METPVIIAFSAGILSLAAGIWKVFKAQSTKPLNKTFSIRIIDDHGNEFTSFEVDSTATHHAGKELKEVIQRLSSEARARTS